MTAKQILSRIEKLKARQAKLRDEFRELGEEVEQHLENADEAVGLIEEAADSVSRLV